jgi:hypothetical protein
LPRAKYSARQFSNNQKNEARHCRRKKEICRDIYDIHDTKENPHKSRTTRRGASGERPLILLIPWLRGVDLNHRPLGYEPNELPDCSTPRIDDSNRKRQRQTSAAAPSISGHADK